MKTRGRTTHGLALGLTVLIIGWGYLACAIEITDTGEVIEQSANGYFNWTVRKLEAIGFADPNQPAYAQVKAAQIAARAELLAILRGIRIRGEYGIIDGLMRKDISEVELEGFISNSYVTTPKMNERGLVEAKAFVYLDNSGNTMLIPQRVLLNQENKKWETSEGNNGGTVSKRTGLIIDARGLGLKPGLAPRVLVEGEMSGTYGSDPAEMAIAYDSGFVGYVGSMEKAHAMKDRIGENPLEIRAVGKANTSDIVIGRLGAAAISRSLKQYDFLKECRVVVVVN